MLKIDDCKMKNAKIVRFNNLNNANIALFNEVLGNRSVYGALCIVESDKLKDIPSEFEYEILPNKILFISFIESEWAEFPTLVANAKSLQIVYYGHNIPIELSSMIQEKTGLVPVKIDKYRKGLVFPEMETTSFENIDNKVFNSIIELEDLLCDDDPLIFDACENMEIIFELESVE